MDDVVVRALFTATTAPGYEPPFDGIQAKVHYPARFSGEDAERLTGAVPPDRTNAPWPVVILLHGINVGPEGYRWLVERIVPAGFAVVTYTMIGELYPPGTYGLTPGIDIAAAGPATYPSRPTCTGIQPILDHLRSIEALNGLLDLDRVVLGGHSAGGTMVLQNARRSLFPSVVAGFAYAAHTLASTSLGWETDDPLAVDGETPILLIGGTRDGVMARSADRYGRAGHDRDPVRRTFEDAIPGGSGHAYLGIIEGANHQTFVHPHDATVARGFLDMDATVDEDQARELIASTIIAFLGRHARSVDSDLDDLLTSRSFVVSERK